MESKPANPDAVLHDQYNDFSRSSLSSQDFGQSLDAYSSQAADDFVVSPNENWLLDHVEVAGAYNRGGPRVESVNIFFYADSGLGPGTPVFTQTNIIPSAGIDSGNFVVPLKQAMMLSEGTYWVSVQANFTRNSTGQWFW